MKARLVEVDDHGDLYQALMFWCPGCERVDGDGERHAGLHMLPISGDGTKRPVWQFDANIKNPTLTPSILSRIDWPEGPSICHSFMRAGRMQFLADCTHPLAGRTVDLPDLPEWAVNE